MTLPWEHEVRLYVTGEVSDAAYENDEGVSILRCTCGRWSAEFPDGIGFGTVADAVAKHDVTHPAPPDPIGLAVNPDGLPAVTNAGDDTGLTAALARLVIARGGTLDDAECRHCHALIRAQGLCPDWAATSPDHRWPALYCPDDPSDFPLHDPVRITERKKP